MKRARRLAAATVASIVLALLVAWLTQRETAISNHGANPGHTVPDPLDTAGGINGSSADPEEALRTALSEFCEPSGAREQSGWQPPDELAMNELAEMKLSLADALSVSETSEHLHVAALMTDDKSSAARLITRAAATGTADPLTLQDAVRICHDVQDATACPLEAWEQRLIQLDGQNSESWILLASNRYQAGNIDAALGALKNAYAAAETRAYWTEAVEIIERGLAAGSDLAFADRAWMAFALAASIAPRYNDYVAMCRAQSADSVEWAYACLAYGESVEAQGRSEIAVSIALTLQQLMHEVLGNAEKAATVERRAESRRRRWTRSANAFDAAAGDLVFSDPALFAAYLSGVRAHGELAAQNHLVEEINQLAITDTESPCAPPGEHASPYP